MTIYELLKINISWFTLVVLILMATFGQTAFLYFGEKQRKKMKGSPFTSEFITIFYRLLAAAFSTITFGLLLFKALCDQVLHITSIEQNTTNILILIVLWFIFVVVSNTAIRRLLFNDRRDFAATVHILIGEYLLCSQSEENKSQMMQWIIAVNAELKRFGLMDTQIGEFVNNIKMDGYVLISLLESSKEKNLYTEENLQKVANILLVMAGDKDTVPAFKFNETKKQ